jgi:deoxyribonuclease V
MKLGMSHSWDLSPKEAVARQEQLAGGVIAETTFDAACIETIAGVDVGVDGGLARAAVVVLACDGLEPVDWAAVNVEIDFPYVPGLLTFREGPGVLAVLAKLTTWPDVLIFDGHGVAHPRRFGLASHMGVLLDHPTVGCAKSRLVGDYEEPGDQVGDWAPLRDGGEVIGAVLRTRAGVRPVFVSVGHRVDLPTAIDLVLRCGRGYRLPETTRYAHRLAGGGKLSIRRSKAGRHR